MVSVSPRLPQTSLYHQLRLLRLLIRTFAISLPKSLCRLNSASSSLSHFRVGLFLGCDAFHITNSLCIYAGIFHSRMCGLISHLISKLSPSPNKPCSVAVVEIATAVSWLLEHPRSYSEKAPNNGQHTISLLVPHVRISSCRVYNRSTPRNRGFLQSPHLARLRNH